MKTAGLFALALVTLACFIAIERRAIAPLLPLRIFQSRTTCAANLASLTLLGTFFSFLFIVALYLQDVLRYSPIRASLALLPGSIASALVSQFVAPWFVNRLGLRLSTGLGMLCLASGIALFARIGLYDDYVGVILPSTFVVMGLGMGMSYPALAIAAVSGIANTEQGLAAGLQSTSLQAGGGLGLAITTAVITVTTALVRGFAQTSNGLVVAQLTGFHVGLYVAAAGAAAGALIALVGIQPRSETPSDAPEQEALH
jgi:Major Facilitator Superfamily